MNKVVLLGRLTKEPELKYAGAANLAICNFTLAVNRVMKKEGQPDADFIQIVALGKTAEFCSKYFSKGLKVAISGRIQIESWEKDGAKHYSTKVLAEQVDFADGKKQNNTQQGGLEPEVNQGFFLIDDNENPFL